MLSVLILLSDLNFSDLKESSYTHSLVMNLPMQADSYSGTCVAVSPGSSANTCCSPFKTYNPDTFSVSYAALVDPSHSTLKTQRKVGLKNSFALFQSCCHIFPLALPTSHAFSYFFTYLQKRKKMKDITHVSEKPNFLSLFTISPSVWTSNSTT